MIMAAPSGIRNLIVAAAASFVFFGASLAFNQALQWTEWTQGAECGIFHIPLLSIVWLIQGLVPMAAISVLFRFLKRPGAPVWVLFIAGLHPAIGLITLPLIHPQTADSRFEGYASASLPPSDASTRAHFSGGLLCDIDDHYYFECQKKETQRVINALNLKPSNDFETLKRLRPPSGFPRPQTWPGATVYTGENDDSFFQFTLITNPEMNRFYLRAWCL